ncbi:unnamed protein product [Kuraishia capsulata CBS 1993]|uniref:PCI domain-containing protein n=1 Tax=Kuraishia capsulata CBS 1993 TaxID=1382522 RepID=W6MU08_9ASCO|nr:uncharacterized protein KUCA_T00001334001 [Kuraishia capsulata CBS 1993]CDK25365.1 unnamed protein product [Kuraishia capsulata CBS 1993]
MSREAPLKAEKDFTETLDEQFPQIEVLAKSDYKTALDKLLLLEKQTRQASDLASSKRIVAYLVDLLANERDWSLLNEQITLLSKKHGQLKNTVQVMIQQVIEHLAEIDDIEVKVETIENIRSITENKIYVELERARVTKILSDILLNTKNDLDKATKVLCELQVETYGSMEIKEKIEFILNQVELCNRKGDYSFAKILSRKILVKSLDKFPELKLHYYNLVIEIALEENDYINIVKYLLSIYSIPLISDNKEESLKVLARTVHFVILAPYSNLQNDLISRVVLDKDLIKLPMESELVKSFTTQELMRWNAFRDSYSAELFKNASFDQSTEKGKLHWEDLQKRIIEHNLRVIAKYYSNITLERLTELLQLPQAEVEANITTMVNEGVIYARINRPLKIVSFIKNKSENELLNDWSASVDELLEHIETIEHLINKEEMMSGIKAA